MKQTVYTVTIGLFLIIAIVPLLYMFGASIIVGGRLSFATYTTVLSEARQLRLLKNSLLIGTGSAIVATLLGVVMGILLYRTDLPFRQVFIFLFLLPLLIPPYLTGASWQTLVSNEGLVGKALRVMIGAGETPIPGFDISGPGGAIFILAVSYFPLVLVLTGLSLRNIEPQMEEVASTMAPPGYVWRRITLGLSVPSILTAMLLVFIFSVGEYGVPSLMQVNVYPLEIFSRLSAFYDDRAATANSLPVIVIILGCFIFWRRYIARHSYMSLTTHSSPLKLIRLRGWKPLGLVFSLLLLLVAVVLPQVEMITRAGRISSFLQAFNTAKEEIINTLITGIISATVLVIMGFFIAYLTERSKGKGSNLLFNLALVSLVVPGSVLGIGLIKVWNHPGLFNYVYSTLAIVVVALVARYVAVSVVGLAIYLKQVDPLLEESAQLSGASWLRTLRKITIPLIRPGIISVWIVCFILSLRELETAVLISPPGGSTLTVRIFSLLHYGFNELVGALCVMLSGFILLMGLIFWFSGRKLLRFS